MSSPNQWVCSVSTLGPSAYGSSPLGAHDSLCPALQAQAYTGRTGLIRFNPAAQGTSCTVIPSMEPGVAPGRRSLTQVSLESPKPIREVPSWTRNPGAEPGPSLSYSKAATVLPWCSELRLWHAYQGGEKLAGQEGTCPCSSQAGSSGPSAGICPADEAPPHCAKASILGLEMAWRWGWPALQSILQLKAQEDSGRLMHSPPAGCSTHSPSWLPQCCSRQPPSLHSPAGQVWVAQAQDLLPRTLDPRQCKGQRMDEAIALLGHPCLSCGLHPQTA